MSFPFGKGLTASIAGDADSGHPQPSSVGGLFSSAKIVSDAAQSAYKRESFDQEKAAGAAEDILNAASTYGKLDEKGYGKYVDQAEDYLRKFRGSEEVKPPTEEEKPLEEKKTGEPVEVKQLEEVKSEEPMEEKPSQENEEKKTGGGGGDAGGYGDYVKMAEGFVEKYQTEKPTKENPSEEEKSGGGGGTAGGYGDYLKMAEGLVEKYQSGEKGDGKAKESGKEEESSGGGYGNYFSMAEDFLKK